MTYITPRYTSRGRFLRADSQAARPHHAQLCDVALLTCQRTEAMLVVRCDWMCSQSEGSGCACIACVTGTNDSVCAAISAGVAPSAAIATRQPPPAESVHHRLPYARLPTPNPNSQFTWSRSASMPTLNA